MFQEFGQKQSKRPHKQSQEAITTFEVEHYPQFKDIKVSRKDLDDLKRYATTQLVLPHCDSILQTAMTYFEQYKKQFQENSKQNAEVSLALADKNEMVDKYNILKRSLVQIGEQTRRKRRTAQDIQREFPCPVEHCHRSYGTEGSLNQHVKIKHYAVFENGSLEIHIQNILKRMEGAEKLRKQE